MTRRLAPWALVGVVTVLLLVTPSRVMLGASPGRGIHTAPLPVPEPAGTFARIGRVAGTGRPVIAATVLADGDVLLVDRRGAQRWDAATGTLSPAGEPAHRRDRGSAAAALDDGRVLVVGGQRVRPPRTPRGHARITTLTAAETWDPATNRFSDAGELRHARDRTIALPLADGRVLVFGGASVGLEAELWDPATRGFTGAGVTPDALAGELDHVGRLTLPDGRLLVTGGALSDGRPAATLFDPLTGGFTPLDIPAQQSDTLIPTALPDGRVLLTATADASCRLPGGPCQGRSTAWTWDPAAGLSAPVSSRDQSARVTALPSGGVLVVWGGSSCVRDDNVISTISCDDPVPSSAATWDPADGSWTQIGAFPGAATQLGPLTVLADGRALAWAAGRPWLIDPTEPSIRPAAADAPEHEIDLIVAVPDGRALLLSSSAEVALWTPAP